MNVHMSFREVVLRSSILVAQHSPSESPYRQVFFLRNLSSGKMLVLLHCFVVSYCHKLATSENQTGEVVEIRSVGNMEAYEAIYGCL